MQSPSSISVRCRLFARYAEIVGQDEVTLSLQRDATVAQAVAVLRQSVPDGARLPEQPMVAVNQEHALAGQVLADGDEIALLPPLAGG
ncbi:MAG: MoaD/ThiS family protein [Gemmatimonadota bacterium]|nr:MAG: MoaD/ThiS family protein [Gemmatimonadota bacterium]